MNDTLDQSAIDLVIECFNGDVNKTYIWFDTPNPLLGNISPMQMIREGRSDRVHKFILNALAGNKP